ncbi:hypothetical protein [Domibacillus indicus]|uniref:hypothetical protein n=1 Tax=Domibacillus indicus TaxID=1437523 RepID=UPI000A963476|nr:hypothetical protein [Domibacillus indicus]
MSKQIKKPGEDPAKEKRPGFEIYTIKQIAAFQNYKQKGLIFIIFICFEIDIEE